MNLFGKRLDDNDKVYSSLSKIKGVSAKAQGTAVDLCLSIGIGKECRVQDVPSDKWSIITELLSAGSTGGREAAIKRELKRVQRSKVLYRNAPRQTQLAGNPLAQKTVDVSVTPTSLAVQYKKARQLTQEYVEGKLLKSIKDNVERLQKTRSYRGVRHLEGLPCRGQRTHTNGGSRRRKGVSSVKK